MDLTNLIKQLRVEPQRFLDSVSPIALGAFMSGYEASNPAVAKLLRDLSSKIDGPSEASVFTRAYLRFDLTEAVVRIIDLIDEAKWTMQEADGGGYFLDGSFIPTIVRAIEDGRPGIMLGEPTVIWLANCWHGFILGLEEADPNAADLERAQFSGFVKWLAERYADSHATWYKLIYVYGGACEDGLEKFAELWREFCGDPTMSQR
ncbi:MAG: hypothetical protein IT382_03440 [Deltaproteobacteria bacterium]|nr:hypothetical protein [Deltaproteobacteria bacterium]